MANYKVRERVLTLKNDVREYNAPHGNKPKSRRILSLSMFVNVQMTRLRRDPETGIFVASHSSWLVFLVGCEAPARL